jgi:predicted unusual protein kinase regulating ubiquinone biosynthesis (AarF/ABC1/UbiB family)
VPQCNKFVDLLHQQHLLRPEVTVKRAVVTILVLARHAARLLVPRRGPFNRRAARATRDAFAELGPTYVKLAQLIASSPGLFPDVLADELRTLLDQAPSLPPHEVTRVITEDLGAPPDEAFAQFTPVPLACASIAQVHAATLLDGTDVVVKVQRPDIEGVLAQDVRILKVLARVIERVSATGRMASPIAVVEDFETTLRAELDFLTEARAMERFTADLRRSSTGGEGIRVPAVVTDLTTTRVLTMERIHGTTIDDLEARGRSPEVFEAALRRGVRAWLESALLHGFFHGDVHAGNLMIDEDGALVYLDFGITGELDEHTRDVLRRALPALMVDGDFRTLAQSVYELGAVLKPADLDQSARDIAEIVGPILGRPLSEISYGEVLVDVIRIGTRYEVRLPRELILVARQLLYFERYGKLLAPDWNMLGDPTLVAFILQPDTAA